MKGMWMGLALMPAIAGCAGGEIHRLQGEQRIVRAPTVVERVAVERHVQPGGRPGGAGDCRAIRRGWEAGDPRLAADEARCPTEEAARDIDWVPSSLTLTDGREVAIEIGWVPSSLTLTDGREVPIEIGSIRVPERRGAPGSRQLTIQLMRLPASAPGDRPPLVYLDGAPDTGPTSRNLRIPELLAFFEPLREGRDVIFMDYRGTGRSGALECPAYEGIQANTFEARSSAIPFFVEQALRCAAALRARGADLNGYTWREVAADVDAVRIGLGVPRVDLLGFSSGTHAALVTAREHAAGVGRIVLVGTEGPDQTRKLPLAGDRQLERVSAAVAAAGGPADFDGLVRGVLTRSEREPFVVSVTNPSGNPLEMRVGRYALAYIATRNMSSPRELRLLVPLFASLSRDDVSVLTQVVQQLAGSPSVLSAATHLMDGSAGISADRSARLRAEAAQSIFADAASFPYPEIEAAWGYDTLEEAYRRPVTSNIPALFITGELDGNTPPDQAAWIARGFSRSTELVVANAGHADPMRMPGVARMIADFLDGEAVGGRSIAAEPMRLDGGR